jgi:hypothetical protein
LNNQEKQKNFVTAFGIVLNSVYSKELIVRVDNKSRSILSSNQSRPMKNNTKKAEQNKRAHFTSYSLGVNRIREVSEVKSNI